MESTNKCKLCNNNGSKYICPRCNIPYCSLACYQSEEHSQCSEGFYRDCVVDQIKNDELDPESKKKMMEILQRVQRIDEDFEEKEEAIDSDDESDCEELAARLAGVDLDDTDRVWDCLTAEEKQEFEQMLRSGDVLDVIPPWEPWWCYREKVTLVQDLDSPSQQGDATGLPPSCPSELQNIQPFSKISKKTPSPCLRWNLVNVLGAYALTARVYNGDHHSYLQEAAATLLTLSETLSANRVFESPELAVAAVHLAACNADCVVGGVDENLLKEDVKKLVEGPSEAQHSRYVLAALSDIHSLLTATKKEAKEHKRGKGSGEFSKRFPDSPATSLNCSTTVLNNYIKKIEYFLSWTKEFF